MPSLLSYHVAPSLLKPASAARPFQSRIFSPSPRPAPLGLENDLYVRQTDGYLPTAEVAFVDEIFKVRGRWRQQVEQHHMTTTHVGSEGAVLRSLAALA